MKFPQYILFFLLLFLSPPASSSPLEEQRLIGESMLKGQELLLRRRYPDALAFFRTLQQEHPNSPAGYFGEMAVHELQMLEREDFHGEAPFLEAARRGERSIDAVMQKYNPTTIELMFAASLYGLEGFFEARRHHWWRSYLLGTKARQIFKRIKKLDSTFVDADFGLGMFLYWRSVFANRIAFISPFIPDRRAEGKKLVRDAKAKGSLTKEMAQMSLGLMAFEEREYSQAAAIFSASLQRYPQNILLRSFLARVFLADKRYEDSVKEFETILRLEPAYQKAHYFIGVNSIFMKQHLEEAERHLKQFLATMPNDEWRSYAFYWLGRLEEERGNKTKASEQYQEAIRLNPEMKEAQFRMRGLGGGL